MNIPSGYFGNSVKNIYHVKNFIKKENIQNIQNYSKSIIKFNGAQNSEIWKNRVCNWDQIKNENEEIYNIINFYINKTKMFIENKFLLSLKITYPSIVVWNIGDKQSPHADKEHIDGTDNGFSFRDISSLIYINNDYEGGEIYFPKQNIEIKPDSGDLVCFPGDKEYMHGVKEITNGKRFTIPMFFTVVSKLN
jgi:predicted 2-oxoglutarate/Fe(II)-dependent dioxygenase YbiX